VRVNLDTILAIKAKNCHGMIHNNIFKNIKLLNVSGLTGPSTGSILIAV
jgi:predicted HNH restriction endonuclease